MNLPVSYNKRKQFAPSPEQLLQHYLKPKISRDKLPCDVIQEKEIYGSNANPWVVLDDLDNLRKAGCGTWCGKTCRMNIMDKTGEIIGKKKLMGFEINDVTGLGDGIDLNKVGYWKMYEIKPPSTICSSSSEPRGQQLLRILLKLALVQIIGVEKHVTDYRARRLGSEAESSGRLKEADPTPISVVEVPSREELSSGVECFKQVSAELHGNKLNDYSPRFFCNSLTLQLRCSNLTMVALFGMLFPKYERMLLFDWIRSAVQEISQSCMYLCPWVKPVTAEFGLKWPKRKLRNEVHKFLEIQDAEVIERISGKETGKGGRLG
ncbi:hypothetical protein POM88_045478 [Heracleum sosnowskyi]|uniref:NAC domain-containing protein n=1 Tax=Heracleum sosnowskyi TaxID=360622 RepID=A0AAD8H7C8_9APIA|nr:hypothetical protein POM88_045478 [Heracleum sosnowskyi]